MSGLSALNRQLRVSLAAGEDTLSVLAVHATAAATPNATDLHTSQRQRHRAQLHSIEACSRVAGGLMVCWHPHRITMLSAVTKYSKLERGWRV